MLVETRSSKAFHFNSSLLVTFCPKEFSAMLFMLLCALDFDEMSLTVTLHQNVMQNQGISGVDIYKRDSFRADGTREEWGNHLF